MAILLNRKYGSRLECLYYILSSCYNRFNTTESFTLNDLKYNEEVINSHSFCKLTKDILGIKCCPFLVNPLDPSKCYATQSVDSDSTKSKAVSDIGGSLEALGFIQRRNGRKYTITSLGEKWIKSDYFSEEWEDIARQGVLSYGLAVGFLSLIKEMPNPINSSLIYLGYPQTEETVLYKDSTGKTHFVEISNGSEADSVTRTKSRIIAWCITVGLIEPCGVIVDNSIKLAHLKYREFLNEKKLTVRKFIKTNLCENIFSKKYQVDNPLTFSRLHKSVEAMRENGGEILRLATLQCKDKILNRRFVFTYILNEYSKLNKRLPFNSLVTEMEKYSSYFFTEGNKPLAIMSSECLIADFAGIPFVDYDGYFEAITTVNTSVLCEDAPKAIIDLANKILKNIL